MKPKHGFKSHFSNLMDVIWDLIVSVPDHCLSFYFDSCLATPLNYIRAYLCLTSDAASMHSSTLMFILMKM